MENQRLIQNRSDSLKSYQRGFTMVELLVVISIVAIISALAIPAYQDYVKEARRSDGQAALIAFAAAMEKHATQNNTYLDAAISGNTGAPAVFTTTAPVGSNAVFYNLTIEEATASTYTLRATPVNAQVGDGFLEITSVNQKRWDEDDNGSIGSGENDWDEG